MNYQELSKDRLIGIIKDYQLLTHQLINEVDRDTSFDVSLNGNVGHWYLNLKTDSLTGNPMRFRALGYTEEEVLQSVPNRDFLSRIHPADVQTIIDNLSLIKKGDMREYEAEYRVLIGEREYKRFYDRGRITQYDDNGRPLFLSGSTSIITSDKDYESENQHGSIELQGEAFLDNLTKTKNRRSLIRDLGSAVELSEQNGNPFIMTLIGIDDFKAVNETKGHLCGNKVLIEIAGLIRQNIGGEGTFGRYRADEFMIIFSRVRLEEAECVLEKIRESVEKHRFHEQVKLTVSGGVKEYEGEDLAEFINAVELKLSQAKICGKNKITN